MKYVAMFGMGCLTVMGVTLAVLEIDHNLLTSIVTGIITIFSGIVGFKLGQEG